MKERVRELWNLCFNDDEAFTELYFSMRYKDEVNIAFEKEEKIISALQILPYPMTFHQTIIPIGYISGACTHPDYRKIGAMKQLLKSSFTRMLENEIYLATLIPANEPLFDYYSNMGFSSVFDYSEEKIEVNQLSKDRSLTIEILEIFDEEIYTFFNDNMCKRDCCIQHTPEDLRVIFAATRLEKGTVYSFKLDNQIVGLAFVSNNDKKINILELVTKDKEEVRTKIIEEIAAITKSDEINILYLPTLDIKRHLGMARIINAEKLLSLYAKQYPKIDICFELIDEMIEKNNACYCLSKGKLTRDIKSNCFLKLTVQQLTQALMGYNLNNLPKELQQFASQTPYMSLMLN